MTTRLYSCYWDLQFGKLARVLEYSARLHCVDWQITVEKFAPPHGLSSAMGIQAHIANTWKLERWKAVIDAVPDGAHILLIDTDTVILRPLDDVWEFAFDVAYTEKPKGSRFPLNGGVVFVRANERSRRLMHRWAERNAGFLRDRRYKLSDARREFGGINQPALGLSVRELASDVLLLALPCAEWNCEDETWGQFGAQTRILHIKSGLRRDVLKIHGPRPKFAHVEAAQAWRQVEQQAIRSPALASAYSHLRAK